MSRNDLWVGGSNVAQQNCIKAPKIEALMPMGELMPAICRWEFVQLQQESIEFDRVCFKVIYVA